MTSADRLGATPVMSWTPPTPPTEEVLAVARRVRAGGGAMVVVGGWVRDNLLGRAPGDMDLEIFGLHPREVLEVLGARAHVVGQDFGVIKVGHLDLGFPRRRRVMGGGARALMEDADPDQRLGEAARRRDFTLGALAWDPLTGELFDPCGGLEDLKARRLRHVDAQTLGDDPVRVLRAAQLVARLDLSVAEQTWGLFPPMVAALPSCPWERPAEELRRLLLKGERVDRGWALLVEVGVVDTLWPELAGGEVAPDQVGEVLRRAAQLRPSEGALAWPRMVAALLHRVGEARARAWIERALGREHLLLKGVPPLVALARAVGGECAHLTPPQLRRMALRAPLPHLAWLAQVLSSEHGEGRARWLEAQARSLGIWEGPPQPLIQGRDLQEEGVKAGKQMGQVLAWLFERQLDGEIHTRQEALALWREHFGGER